jgi:hypothetical protein
MLARATGLNLQFRQQRRAALFKGSDDTVGNWSFDPAQKILHLKIFSQRSHQ